MAITKNIACQKVKQKVNQIMNFLIFFKKFILFKKMKKRLFKKDMLYISEELDLGIKTGDDTKVACTKLNKGIGNDGRNWEIECRSPPQGSSGTSYSFIENKLGNTAVIEDFIKEVKESRAKNIKVSKAKEIKVSKDKDIIKDEIDLESPNIPENLKQFIKLNSPKRDKKHNPFQSSKAVKKVETKPKRNMISVKPLKREFLVEIARKNNIKVYENMSITLLCNKIKNSGIKTIDGKELKCKNQIAYFKPTKTDKVEEIKVEVKVTPKSPNRKSPNRKSPNRKSPTKQSQKSPSRKTKEIDSGSPDRIASKSTNKKIEPIVEVVSEVKSEVTFLQIFLNDENSYGLVFQNSFTLENVTERLEEIFLTEIHKDKVFLFENSPVKDGENLQTYAIDGKLTLVLTKLKKLARPIVSPLSDSYDSKGVYKHYKPYSYKIEETEMSPEMNDYEILYSFIFVNEKGKYIRLDVNVVKHEYENYIGTLISPRLTEKNIFSGNGEFTKFPVGKKYYDIPYFSLTAARHVITSTFGKIHDFGVFKLNYEDAVNPIIIL